MKKSNLLFLIFGLILLVGFASAIIIPEFPECGNGIVEEGEECDSSDTEICSDCNYTYLGDGIQQCQNGEGVCEECDDADFGGASCEGLGYDSGSLICDGGSIDDSDCWNEDNEEENDSIMVYLDPKYINDTLKHRKFKLDKITPFDDIICEVSKDYAGARGVLMTQDDSGAWTVVITSGSFDANGKWPINGWDYSSSGDENIDIGNPVGWGSNNAAIEQVIKTGKVRCSAEKDGKEISVSSEELGQEKWVHAYTNCLHVWQGNKVLHSFGFSFGESVESSAGPIQRVTKARQHFVSLLGFSPFLENQNLFSSYVILNTIKGDSTFPLSSGSGRVYFNDNHLFIEVGLQSTCPNLNVMTFYHAREEVTDGYARDLLTNQNVLKFDRGATSFVHETAHSFGGVLDEYYDETLDVPLGYAQKNCIATPNWGEFGEHTHRGCLNNPFFYRPSGISIMSYVGIVPFNVVSCGYILQQIKVCSNIQNCWEQCMNPRWNTIKPGSGI